MKPPLHFFYSSHIWYYINKEKVKEGIYESGFDGWKGMLSCPVPDCLFLIMYLSLIKLLWSLWWNSHLRGLSFIETFNITALTICFWPNYTSILRSEQTLVYYIIAALETWISRPSDYLTVQLFLELKTFFDFFRQINLFKIYLCIFLLLMRGLLIFPRCTMQWIKLLLCMSLCPTLN